MDTQVCNIFPILGRISMSQREPLWPSSWCCVVERKDCYNYAEAACSWRCFRRGVSKKLQVFGQVFIRCWREICVMIRSINSFFNSKNTWAFSTFGRLIRSEVSQKSSENGFCTCLSNFPTVHSQFQNLPDVPNTTNVADIILDASILFDLRTQSMSKVV